MTKLISPKFLKVRKALFMIKFMLKVIYKPIIFSIPIALKGANTVLDFNESNLLSLRINPKSFMMGVGYG
jgi:hypothetical protein